MPGPKTQELDSDCVGATASASAAANAAAASATANAAAATTHTHAHTRTHTHTHTHTPGPSPVCTWCARGVQRLFSALQRACSEELTLVSKTWLPSGEL